MSSKKGKNRPSYFIFFKDEKYKVDPIVFSKFSQKFAREFTSNPDGLEIKEVVSPSAVMTFLKMCQEKEYNIEYDDAHDITLLTRNWECPILEGVAVNFCYKNNLVVRPKYDPIGILLDAIDNQKETTKELVEVAKVLNNSFDDDRLPDIEPELLFRIVVIAEKEYSLNMKDYTKFVMKMYDQNPPTAVILSLRLPFDDLTPEELATIKKCPDLRFQSINFFFAHSLSIVRKLIQDKSHTLIHDASSIFEQQEREEKLQEEIFYAELNRYKDEKKEKIEKRLNEQKEEIEELYQRLLVLSARLDGSVLASNGLTDKRILISINKANREINEIQNRISESLAVGKQGIHERTREGIGVSKARWEKIHTNHDALLNLIKENLSMVEALSKRIVSGREEIDQELAEIQATINAKIVRDKLRCDKGRRNDENKFSIFDEDKREDIIKADMLLEDLESRIERNCPLRTH